MKTISTLILTLFMSINMYSQNCDTAWYNYFSRYELIYHFEDTIWSTYDSIYYPTDYIPFEIDTSASGIWKVGKPNKGSDFDSAYSGEHTIITEKVNTYPIGNYSYFDVKYTPIETASLRFKYKMDSDTLADGGYITVSYDNGMSWENIMSIDYFHPYWSYLNVCTPYLDTLINGEIGISGSTMDWTDFIMYDANDIDAVDTVIYRFHFVSDSIETNKKGWMIDDIKLFTTLIVGVDEISQTQIILSPNPSQGQVFIELKNLKGTSANFSGEILNTSGQIVKEFDLVGTTQSLLSIDELPNGIYFVKIFNDKKMLKVERLIKSGG